jgi:hypothetical protein
MIWRVSTKDGDIPFSAMMLTEVLLDKFMQAGPRPDRELLVEVFSNFLQEKKSMQQVRLIELMLMCFSLGFYYKTFMTNNEVKIIEVQSEENDSAETNNTTDS